MRVLITGGSGFLGTNLLKRLPEDWEVTVNTQNLMRPWEGDSPYDLGIHLAANVQLREGVKDPQVDIASLTMLNNLLHGCQFGTFVYLSSGAVYDGLRGPVHPQVPCKPILPYAISKLAGEQLVKHYQKNLKTIGEYLILRFFGAYGPHEPSWKLATKLLTATEPVTLMGDGYNLIDAMYVEDAVEMLITMAKGSPGNLTVDWAAHDPISIRQFVAAVQETKDIPPVTFKGETHENIQFFSVHNVVRQYWGIGPKVRLREGLKLLKDHLESV